MLEKAAARSLHTLLDSAVNWRRAWPVLLAFASGAAYYLAAEVGLALRVPGLAVSAIWPPNAILLSLLLLLTPPSRWWIPLVSVIPAHLLAHADAGVPLWRLFWQLGHNLTLTSSTALLLRGLTGSQAPFGSLRDLTIYLLVGVLAVPAAVNLVAPNPVLSWLNPALAAGQPVWLAWRSTYLSNAAGFLILVPAIVLWGTEGRRWLLRATASQYLEIALLGAGLGATSYFALAGPSASPAVLYALLPPLLWAAARFGVIGVASMLSVIAIGSILFAIDGRGPFIERSPVENVFRLQMFLLAIAVPLLMLAVVMKDRARATAALRSERRALGASHARIQELARRLMRAHEIESARIARDLHDDVGQQLAALALRLHQVSQRLPEESAELAGELLAAQESVGATMRSLRGLSHALHPASLRHIGLAQALRGYCGEFGEAHRITVSVESSADAVTLSPDVALCLFRVTQEALRNVAQHARAGRIQVNLAYADSTVSLSIRDDGRGFERSAAVGSGGLGLVSLEERVAAVGGRLALHTRPGHGTTVTVKVPVHDGAS